MAIGILTRWTTLLISFFSLIFVYLAVVGLSCNTWDLFFSSSTQAPGLWKSQCISGRSGSAGRGALPLVLSVRDARCPARKDLFVCLSPHLARGLVRGAACLFPLVSTA